MVLRANLLKLLTQNIRKKSIRKQFWNHVISILMKMNPALFSSAMYKFRKNLYLSTYYRAFVTYENKEIKCYQFEVLGGRSEYLNNLFLWYIKEIPLKFWICINQTKVSLFQNSHYNANFKLKGIKNLEIKVEETYQAFITHSYIRNIIIPYAILKSKEFK